MTTTTQTQIAYLLRMNDEQLARAVASFTRMLDSDTLPGVIERAAEMLKAGVAEQQRRAGK